MTERNRINPTELAAYDAEEPDPGGERDDPGLRDLSDEEIEHRQTSMFIESLHHQPGDPIPEWWEECPVCLGAKCWRCDGTGRVHPRREEWLGDALASAELPVCLAARLLLEGEGAEAQVNQFLLAIDTAASAFVDACVPPGQTWGDLLAQYFPRGNRARPGTTGVGRWHRRHVGSGRLLVAAVPGCTLRGDQQPSACQGKRFPSDSGRLCEPLWDFSILYGARV